MNIYFRNFYPKPVWIALMRYDPSGCGQYGNWNTKGWWRCEPGQQRGPFYTNNRYAAFYAKASDGAEWTGGYGPIYVYHAAFNSCVGIGSTGAYDTVGCRLIDGGSYSNYTVNLFP